MTPLNTVMNKVAIMAESDAILKKIAVRAITVIGVLPLEVMTTALGLIKLPFDAALSVCKIPLKVTNLFARSKSLRSLERSLPTPRAVVITALKIVGYALGTLFTLILGVFISPKMNFDLHVSLGLIRNERAEAQRLQAELQVAKRRAAVAQELEDNINRIALANKAKIAEKERELVLEAQKQREILEAANRQIQPDAVFTSTTALQENNSGLKTYLESDQVDAVGFADNFTVEEFKNQKASDVDSKSLPQLDNNSPQTAAAA